MSQKIAKIAVWLSGNVLISMNSYSVLVSGMVNTEMGDHLHITKPYHYVTQSHRSTQPGHPSTGRCRE